MRVEKLLHEKVAVLERHSKEALLNSAVALSQLTGEPVDILNHYANVIKTDEIGTFFLEDSERLTAIELEIYGRLRGDIFLIISNHDTQQLITKVAAHGLTGEISENMKTSLLMEMGNIIASSYINVLGESFGSVLIPSVPHLSYLDSREDLPVFFVKGRDFLDHALMLTCEFFIGGMKVRVLFLFLIHAQSIEPEEENA
jgi:chemotaxis protein CheC